MQRDLKADQAETDQKQLVLFWIFLVSISKTFQLFTYPSLLQFPTTGSYCPSNAEQNMPTSWDQIQNTSYNVPTTKASSNTEITEN